MPGPETLCVYQFKVVLRGISPMIWRRLLLRSDHSIADLHYTIQIAMGWSDSHLHRFHIHGKDYGVAHEGGLTFSDDPDRVRLAQLRGNWCHILVDWAEAGQVLDPIKAVPEAAPQKLRRCVTSSSRLNVQFFTNGGGTPDSSP